MDPLGQFLFIANARGNTYVNRIDPSTGALAPVPGSPFAVGGDNSITADPTGRFVYMPRGRSCPTGQSSLCIDAAALRSEEHTSELQSQSNLVCRLLLETKKTCD